MATIAEIKGALAAERGIALEAAERSLDAIDKVTATGSFWLTALAVIVALLALVGFTVVIFGSRRVAKDIAQRRINSYLESKEGLDFVQGAIAAEVKKQMEGRIFTAVVPQDVTSADGSFQKDPKEKGDGHAA